MVALHKGYDIENLADLVISDPTGVYVELEKNEAMQQALCEYFYINKDKTKDLSYTLMHELTDLALKRAEDEF